MTSAWQIYKSVRKSGRLMDNQRERLMGYSADEVMSNINEGDRLEVGQHNGSHYIRREQVSPDGFRECLEHTFNIPYERDSDGCRYIDYGYFINGIEYFLYV